MLISDSFLKQFPIFQDLTNEELKRLKDISIERLYKKGDIIFHQNESRNSVFFIKMGLVKIFKVDQNGNEQTVNVLHSDEMFPHVGFFDETPYPATAIAIKDTQMVVVPIDEFELLLMENPSVAIKVMRVIGKKLIEMQERLQSIQTQDVFHQIVTLLVRFAEELGQKQSNGILYLELPITNSELASMIGASRETVNRAFNRLKKEGIMTYNRKEIHISDYQKLKYYR